MDHSAIDNPYLAHRRDLEGSKKPSHALDGVMPRKINAKQALKAMVCALTDCHARLDSARSMLLLCLQEAEVNPFTNRPFTSKYKEILTKRKNLPVFNKMQDFLSMFNDSQMIVMEVKASSCLASIVPVC